jgi:TRAP-type C4-dicarboxylate transport system substrate-binding protein
LVISKQVFDALPKEQQDLIIELGRELEDFGIREAMADAQMLA